MSEVPPPDAGDLYLHARISDAHHLVALLMRESMDQIKRIAELEARIAELEGKTPES